MDVKRPVRVSHQYTQRIRASTKEVFPLLCPVREQEWIPRWDPVLVAAESGIAEPQGEVGGVPNWHNYARSLTSSPTAAYSMRPGEFESPAS